MHRITILSLSLLSILWAVACDTGDGGETNPPDAPTPDAGVGQVDAVEPDIAVVPDVAPEPVCPDPTGDRPMRRSEHAGIYDPVGDRLVIYGGTLAVPVNCSFPTPTFESETWIYEVDCGLWRQVGGASPGGRNRHMTVYDSSEHRMILFGGRYRSGSSGPYVLYNDLWSFDLTTETWSQITAQGTPWPCTSSAPSPWKKDSAVGRSGV